MLDIKFIRSNPEAVKTSLIKRNEFSIESQSNLKIIKNANLDPADRAAVQSELLKHVSDVEIDFISKLEETDQKRRELTHQLEQLKAQRNNVSKQIGARKAAKQPADDLLEGMKDTSKQIKQLETEVSEVESEQKSIIMTIPNIVHQSSPTGTDESFNKIIKVSAANKELNFKPIDHIELGNKLQILDLERAAKLSGARFSVLTGTGAMLERALINFMLDTHTQKHGYKEACVPFMVNSAALEGTGQLPKFEEDLFKINNTESYLIPTAEVPLTNLHASEIIDESQLPIKYVSYTPCFRSEAGSYGRDTKGLIRQHQFNKVELVKFCHPDQSYAELESLLSDARHILELLELPHRVVDLATGDIGFSAAKTYDLEVWVPSQNQYREVSSCSNFEDFQARRAKIRFKDHQKKGPTSFVHTLNGSGLAVGRIWLAIIENYQDGQGNVTIPKVLRPYMNNLTCL